MDFTLPEEVTMLQQTVRRFVNSEVIPLEHDFLPTGKLEEAEHQRLVDKLRDMGLWALGVPEKYGGNELSMLARCTVTEELNRSAIRVGPGGGVPEAIVENATPYLEERFILPTVRGEKTNAGAFAYTEPNGGSDLQGIETHAERDGDTWILNGNKIFISGGDKADYMPVMSVTNKQKRGRGGMSVLVVEKGMPGFQVARTIPTMGDEWEPTELFFTDVRVPHENMVGEEGQGFFLGTNSLADGRLNIGAINIGLAARCLEMSIDYAKQRVTFGEPIGNRQAIQWMLADSALEIYSGRLMVWHVAWMRDHDKPIRNEAFYVKLHCTEMSGRVADRAIQIFGGSGYTKDLPLQSFYRGARLWRIGHGTSEIHRWMIARNLLK